MLIDGSSVASIIIGRSWPDAQGSALDRRNNRPVVRAVAAAAATQLPLISCFILSVVMLPLSLQNLSDALNDLQMTVVRSSMLLLLLLLLLVVPQNPQLHAVVRISSNLLR